MERVRTLFRRSDVKNAPKADELLNRCMETIQKVSAQYSGWSSEDDTTKDYLMNKHQCNFLVGRLTDTRGTLQQIQRSPLLDEKTIPVLEELHQVLLDVEAVISASLITPSQWPRAAIEQSDMKETFARLLYGVQWHVSVLQSILVDNSRESSITFEPAMCEGELSVGEELSLLTAMKEDEESLKDRLRSVRLDDPTEKRLASELLKLKMRSEEEDHPNTSSQSPENNGALEDLESSLVTDDSTGFTLITSSPDLLLLNPEELDLNGTLLGRGGFAEVKQMKLMGGKYAIKILEMDDTKAFDQEMSALQSLGRHPHIVRLLGYSKDDTEYDAKRFLIMEEMNKSLETVFKEYRKSKKRTPTRPFSDVQAVSLILQIGEGVKYIHSKRMVHRDLKPGNVLVNLDSSSRIRSVKIADFGLTKTKDATQTYSNQTLNQGTTKWMAPEVIQGDDPEDKSRFNPRKADVYSFAIICCEILTGEAPYRGLERNEIKGPVKAGTLRPNLPKDCPPKLAALIERCWHTNPQERPLFPEICRELRYIKGLLLRGDRRMLDDDLPIRSVKRVQIQGPWGGGSGGHEFFDVGTSINWMKLRYQSPGILGTIEVEYSFAGISWRSFRGTIYEDQHAKLIVFEPLEYITHINGYMSKTHLAMVPYGALDVVTSLTIHTNIKSYGPFGDEEGEPFTSGKGRIIGFHGRCGLAIDSLGVVVVPHDTS